MLRTFHHALLDGRSFPIVLREVFAAYTVFRDGVQGGPQLAERKLFFDDEGQSHFIISSAGRVMSCTLVSHKPSRTRSNHLRKKDPWSRTISAGTVSRTSPKANPRA